MAGSPRIRCNLCARINVSTNHTPAGADLMAKHMVEEHNLMEFANRSWYLKHFKVV